MSVTVTTRRSALRGAGLASLAGMIGATAAKASTTTPDAALILVCAEKVALQKEFDALFGRRFSIEKEHETSDELSLLYDRENEIEDRMRDLPPPTTLAGARAMAGIALMEWKIANPRELPVEDWDEWVNISIVKCLAGGALT